MHSIKWQVSVVFLMASSSFRVRQMMLHGYVSTGSPFQLLELLTTSFVGVSWFDARLVPAAIYLTLLNMFLSIVSIFLSCHGAQTLEYYGTYRTKYLVEAVEQWPMDRLVQAETCLDVMLNMLVVRALEEVERELIELRNEQEAERIELRGRRRSL